MNKNISNPIPLFLTENKSNHIPLLCDGPTDELIVLIEFYSQLKKSGAKLPFVLGCHQSTRFPSPSFWLPVSSNP